MEDMGVSVNEDASTNHSRVVPNLSEAIVERAEENEELNASQDENGNPLGIKETLDKFCQKLTSTRTAIIDLEYVISDYIEEARAREMNQKEQIRLIRDLAKLEETVKEHKYKHDLMASQIFWLHTALWKVAGHFGMAEHDMRDIYNNTSEVVQDFYDQKAAQDLNDMHGLSEYMTYDNQSDFMSSSSSSSDDGSQMG